MTVFAPIKLAKRKAEADLLAASAVFQRGFVAHGPGVLRRELVRKPGGTYLDIVQFQSEADDREVTQKGMQSPVCATFFSVMDLSGFDPEAEMDLYISLEKRSADGAIFGIGSIGPANYGTLNAADQNMFDFAGADRGGHHRVKAGISPAC